MTDRNESPARNFVGLSKVAEVPLETSPEAAPEALPAAPEVAEVQEPEQEAAAAEEPSGDPSEVTSRKRK